MRTKFLAIYLLVFSLSFANSTTIDLKASAYKNQLKNQVFVDNKIYKIYSKPLIGTAINFAEDELIEEAVFGDGFFWNGLNNGNQIIIKPKEHNLKTTLYVTTTRGKYYFEVVALEKNSELYNPVINFLYPQDIVDNSIKLREKRNNEILLKASNIENLNNNYKWKQKYSWSPTNIVDDGEKTYIFLSVEDQDIPSFYMRKNGELMIVLSRIVENKNGQKVMVIDRTFKEGILALHKKIIDIRNKNK